MAAWSKRLSQILTAPGGIAWYRHEVKYNSIIVREKTLADNACIMLPSRRAWATRIGKEATDRRNPMPWLMALATSSPKDWERSTVFMDPISDSFGSTLAWPGAGYVNTPQE